MGSLFEATNDRWNTYFMGIAEAVGKNSSCTSRKIGAILVLDKSIISTGYNGPPRGIPHCVGTICPRKKLGYKSGEGLHLCPAGHAERNAIVNAARMGIGVKGSTMYCTCGVPCKDCMIEIINAGIHKIFVIEGTFYDDLSKFLVTQSSINIGVLPERY